MRIRGLHQLTRLLSMAAPTHTALADAAPNGAFQRAASGHRSIVAEDSDFPPESGRYHLYVAHACPWANRCSAMLKLKKLEQHIGLSVVHPTWQRTKPEVDDHAGWVFRSPSDPPVVPLSGFGEIPCSDCIPDTVNGAKTVRELYDLAGDTFKKYSVPVFWDKKKNTIGDWQQ